MGKGGVEGNMWMVLLALVFGLVFFSLYKTDCF